MIIFDNIVFNIQKSGGVSVVWGELIKRFEQDAFTDIKYIEYLNPLENIVRSGLSIDVNRILKIPIYSLLLERYQPLKLREEKKMHVFHSSYYRYSKNPYAINFTTVHDFTYELFSNGVRASLHKWQKFTAIRHSDYVVCISENTKKDLMKLLPDVNSDKIHVIYNGVADDYFVINNEVSMELPFPADKYLLFVGARVGYKGFEFAIRSLIGLSHKLVIVGAPLSEKEINFLNRCIGEDNYVCVGRISNEYLNVLYNNAFALLYPSLYEGFGIPVIEAQKAGCPVIAYNASSIPEIIGDTPLLLNSWEEKELREKLKILEDLDKRNAIIDMGIKNAQRFSWDITYSKYKELYSKALNL